MASNSGRVQSGRGSGAGRFDTFRDRKLVDIPQETTRLLLDSTRIARETEDIGVRTAEEMRIQREKLEETGEHIDSMKNITQTAKASIREMQDRIFRKKLCLWIVMILLLLANLAVIMALIRNHGKLFRPAPP